MRATRYKKGSSHSFAICNIKIFNGAEVHELPLALMRGTSIVRYSYGGATLAQARVQLVVHLHVRILRAVMLTAAPPPWQGSWLQRFQWRLPTAVLSVADFNRGASVRYKCKTRSRISSVRPWFQNCVPMYPQVRRVTFILSWLRLPH